MILALVPVAAMIGERGLDLGVAELGEGAVPEKLGFRVVRHIDETGRVEAPQAPVDLEKVLDEIALALIRRTIATRIAGTTRLRNSSVTSSVWFGNFLGKSLRWNPAVASLSAASLADDGDGRGGLVVGEGEDRGSARRACRRARDTP